MKGREGRKHLRIKKIKENGDVAAPSKQK